MDAKQDQIIGNNQDFFSIYVYLKLSSYSRQKLSDAKGRKILVVPVIFSCLASKWIDFRNEAIISKNLVYNIPFFGTDLLQKCKDFCYSYRRQLVSLLPGSVIAAWAGKQGCLHKKGGLRRHVISVLQIYTTFAEHTWVWEQ